MNLLTIENAAKSYGERILFEKVTFGIDEGDKIGLIGVNGTGKSTFLKVIAGIGQPDEGKITLRSGTKIEYLPQNPEFDPEATVLAQVFKGSSPVMLLLGQYEEALKQAAMHPGDTIWQNRLIGLSQQMDAHNAWQLESDAKSILTKLGITDFSAAINTLSGGQRKRVALASALINPADILILDEPTNHIDNDTVAWLEQYLGARKGALLMITHDRYFLDRVVGRILELDKGRLFSYSGNYTAFLELKAAREEQEEGSERKRQNLLRNELEWIKRGAKARSTKQKARIDRFEQLSSQKPVAADAKLEIEAGAARLGRKIIELEKVGHKFNGPPLIQDFSYTILRNDRIGIVGPNGSGKSTLLNIIAGQLSPDQGVVDVGATVKIGYFSQENGDMNMSLRVIDSIKEIAHFLPTADGGTIGASQMLERFLFPPSLQWMPVSKLSGGERRRLYLLQILMGAPNVLLLDEPTNDLDIQTLTIIEDYLDEFPGAVVTVSHDRYFLDRLADKIFAFEGEGVITQYAGGYSDYQEKRRPVEAETAGKASDAGKKEKVPEKADRPRKFTFKEQREYDQIDEVIAGVEHELQQIADHVSTAGSNFELLQELVGIQQGLEQRLDELMERWTYLSELAEEMKKSC
jgi:ATP-binding cassette subfamily F protein uup